MQYEAVHPGTGSGHIVDTEGRQGFWNGIDNQINEMITRGRAPDWIQDNIVITDDPKDVIDAYRTRLQLF